MLNFPPFRLDTAEQQLWKGTKLVAVRRKPFAILRYLVSNPRRLVTHDELLKEVWAGSVVSESSVRSHLHELRQVLGEGLIETVIGRGYRFTGDVEKEGNAPTCLKYCEERLVVGRADELRVLESALEKARGGHRQVVFVTGEPGIGKTTLVDAFLESIADTDVFAVRGACIEQHSTPEAYRPVIEMLGQLRNGKHGDAVIQTFVRHAPTFLAQFPQFVPDALLDEVKRRGAGGSESKIMRELMELFEAVSMHTTHVIVLEDLQWSDVATIDLLSLLGQRRERAKLLVIATSRRAEAQTVTHPLNRVMRALIARHGASALPVERLEDCGEYIQARFPQHAFPPGFVETVEKVTEGTPLYLTTLLDDLGDRGMIAKRDGTWTLAVGVDEIAAHRPDSLKQLIDIQLDRLTAQEQRVLEVASLVGLVFPTALVAAALEMPVETADELCDSLARRALFLQHEGTEDWPDGSLQSCYGFTHGLVRDACTARIAPARRQRWHRAIAERLDAAYGHHSHDVCVVLAGHYEAAQMFPRAIEHYVSAAERMVKQYASGDSLPSYQRALRLLERLPETRERDATELRILGGMSTAVLRARVQAPETIARLERMVALARKLGDAPALCTALMSLSMRYSTLAQYDKAIAVNAELADMPGAPAAAVAAARVVPLVWQGKPAEATELLEAVAGGDAVDDSSFGILDAVARKIVLISYLGAMYWAIGKIDRSMREFERAHVIARDRRDPFAFGLTRTNLANIRLFRRDDPALIRAEAESVLANPDAVLMWQAQAAMLLTWVQSTEAPLSAEVVDEMLARFTERCREIPMGSSFAALKVIDAIERSGFRDRALAFVDEMLVHVEATGERMFEPELLRVRGKLTGNVEDVRRAHALAERMGARMMELRAANDLGDKALIAAALAHIEGGDDLPDVLDAKRLLG